MKTFSPKTLVDSVRLDKLRKIAGACKQSDRRRAALVAHAIRRIQEGTYGYCMTCGLHMAERDTESKPERENCPNCETAAKGCVKGRRVAG